MDTVNLEQVSVRAPMAVTPAQVAGAFARLAEAKAVLHEALEAELAAKQELAVLRGNWLVELGKLAGSNEAEREAKARQVFPDEYADVANAEAEVRRAKLECELAALAVDRVKLETRLLEFYGSNLPY